MGVEEENIQVIDGCRNYNRKLPNTIPMVRNTSGRPGGSVVKPRNLLTLEREFESRCSHTNNWDCFLPPPQKKCPTSSGERLNKSLVHKNSTSRSTRETNG